MDHLSDMALGITEAATTLAASAAVNPHRTRAIIYLTDKTLSTAAKGMQALSSNNLELNCCLR